MFSTVNESYASACARTRALTHTRGKPSAGIHDSKRRAVWNDSE